MAQRELAFSSAIRILTLNRSLFKRPLVFNLSSNLAPNFNLADDASHRPKRWVSFPRSSTRPLPIGLLQLGG